MERTIVESFMHRFTIADFEAMQLSDNPQYVQQTETYLYPGYEGLASLSNQNRGNLRGSIARFMYSMSGATARAGGT